MDGGKCLVDALSATGTSFTNLRQLHSGGEILKDVLFRVSFNQPPGRLQVGGVIALPSVIPETLRGCGDRSLPPGGIETEDEFYSVYDWISLGSREEARLGWRVGPAACRTASGSWSEWSSGRFPGQGWLNTLPPIMTQSMRCVALMSSRGLPGIATMSARRPTSITPRSSLPRRSAA